MDSYKKFFIYSSFFIFLLPINASSYELEELLSLAYKNNAGLKSIRNLAKAEKFQVLSAAKLSDPTIGISVLNRGQKTRYGIINQKFKFPTKYYLSGKAQNEKAKSYGFRAESKKLAIRERLIAAYYAIYSMQKIIQLSKVNIQRVSEFARVAEKKYAAGKSPQGDSMRAHFEITQLELELVQFKQEEKALQDKLKSILNDKNLSELNFYKKNIPIPKLKGRLLTNLSKDLESNLKKNSPILKQEFHLLEAAKAKSSLSKWNFMPDVHLQYQKGISGKPIDSEIYSISLNFPLWFWSKKSEISAAFSKEMAQEHKFSQLSQELIAKARDLEGRVRSGLKTLRIYETSLIPQAQGAYNSIRAAYRANKTSFLDILDSERSLYKVKTGFYRSLSIYVKNITQLESELGSSISTLSYRKM